MLQIMNYREMLRDGRLEKAEIAELCELFISGVSITKLGTMFNMRNEKIYGYLNQYYYGVIPKAFQMEVTLQSKINGENLFFDH